MAQLMRKHVASLHFQPTAALLVLVSVIFSLIASMLPSTNAHAVGDPYHYVPSEQVHSLHTTPVDSEDEVGFRIKVTHMDAPSSPFNIRRASRAELHSRLVDRDLARVDAIGKHLRKRKRSRHHSSKAASADAGASLKDPVKSGLTSGTGEYFVTLQVCSKISTKCCNF